MVSSPAGKNRRADYHGRGSKNIGAGSIAQKGSVVGTMEVAPWVLLFDKKNGNGTRRNGNQFRTACGKGHEYKDGSFSLEKGVRRCLVCREEQRALWAARQGDDYRAMIRERDSRQKRERYAAKKLGISVEEYRRGLGGSTLKKNPLDSLMVNGAEAQAQDRVNFAVDDKGRPKCEVDPDAWFFDDDAEVSNETAAAMCAGCPIIAECLERMKFAAPTKGVMVAGARVFVDGKLQAK